MNTDKYSNLRTKTIFDFCDDNKILGIITGFNPEFDDRVSYAESYRKDPPLNGDALVCYAEYVGNKELLKAVKKEFANDLANIYNE
jgi:hypothetical protein